MIIVLVMVIEKVCYGNGESVNDCGDSGKHSRVLFMWQRLLDLYWC